MLAQNLKFQNLARNPKLGKIQNLGFFLKFQNLDKNQKKIPKCKFPPKISKLAWDPKFDQKLENLAFENEIWHTLWPQTQNYILFSL